ncbi:MULTISPECIES: putative quinol monooxygenase [Gluconacetobacter]|uniref:Antibiotic biosynthesis monooxygenase n=2 Tax=Gluconacetobacter TaxID=89583 RepID=A0A7W4JD38_9PROT|nr:MULTISPECIES: putative quinol monooxygenase [Gluconacetobacter]MBB2172688.1 antibiotic biosynthesis monooxygenase [Gluconacetobacter asukensis]MBB2178879.1 antibiotic biosynthesis monooxygenase [Gluconacetobacter tumulicola]
MDATPLTIIAEFTTTDENRTKFLEFCAYDAERSVADEAGCHAFDVLLPDGEPHTVILHEVYTDRAAFDTHLTTPHYKVFEGAVRDLGIQTVAVRFLATHRA